MENLQRMRRDELLDLFHQFCVPYGQRRYRDSGRGKVLNKTRNISPELVTTYNTFDNKSMIKINRKTLHSDSDRLKPPPDTLSGQMKRIKLDNNLTSTDNISKNKRRMSVDAVSWMIFLNDVISFQRAIIVNVPFHFYKYKDVLKYWQFFLYLFHFNIFLTHFKLWGCCGTKAQGCDCNETFVGLISTQELLFINISLLWHQDISPALSFSTWHIMSQKNWESGDWSVLTLGSLCLFSMREIHHETHIKMI